MSQVMFYREYHPVAIQVLQYKQNYRSMSTADRTIGAVDNAQRMNKVFANKIQDEMLGQHIDMFG